MIHSVNQHRNCKPQDSLLYKIIVLIASAIFSEVSSCLILKAMQLTPVALWNPEAETTKVDYLINQHVEG